MSYNYTSRNNTNNSSRIYAPDFSAYHDRCRKSPHNQPELHPSVMTEGLLFTVIRRRDNALDSSWFGDVLKVVSNCGGIIVAHNLSHVLDNPITLKTKDYVFGAISLDYAKYATYKHSQHLLHNSLVFGVARNNVIEPVPTHDKDIPLSWLRVNDLVVINRSNGCTKGGSIGEPYLIMAICGRFVCAKSLKGDWTYCDNNFILDTASCGFGMTNKNYWLTVLHHKFIPLALMSTDTYHLTERCKLMVEVVASVVAVRE